MVTEDPLPSATQVLLDGTIPAELNHSEFKKKLQKKLQSEMALDVPKTRKMTAEIFSEYIMILLRSVTTVISHV